MTVTYHCARCSEEFDIEVTPGTLAKLHGLPEDCYPGEDEDVYPTSCPAINCNQHIDTKVLQELIEQRHLDFDYDYRDEYDDQ